VQGDEAPSAKLGVSPEEARHVANLLRYAISLNTAVGLVRAERRLTSSTYRAVELAALVLEGKPLEEAAQEAANAWTGSLEEDHRRALALLKTQREALMQAMSGHLTPEQLAQYMEVNADEFLELVRPRTASSRETKLPEG
jgi:DNA-directed RNA polymerase specialized sigma24 family protein